MELQERQVVVVASMSSGARGDDHTLILIEDGRVMGIGRNHRGQTGTGSPTDSVETATYIPDVNGAVAVAGGAMHSLILLGDGSILAFGLNGNG